MLRYLASGLLVQHLYNLKPAEKPNPRLRAVGQANNKCPTLAALKPGSYVSEVVAMRGEEEVGRDSVAILREDGVAESFGTAQNRELLEKLSQSTGGQYWKPDQLGKLASELAYSQSGISIRETRDLQDAPILFLAAVLLRAAEWLLRRKWGVV